jgi:hypothetical protein
MKRLTTLCLIALGLLVSQVSINAQGPGPTGPDIPRPSEASFPGLPRVPTTDAWSGSNSISREPKVVNKGILAPAASDVAQHQFLLSQKNTGMMRLLPREVFDWGLRTVRKKVPLRGGGAYFSFHYRSHEYGYGSDISYQRGLLQVGFAGADYGMLTDLGDTPLESITKEDPRAHFLLNYKPPRKEKDARIEAKKFSAYHTPHGLTGFTLDEVPYRNRFNAVLNHTYLLRSINYGTSDVLVAFRVVSIGEDGGLTIAWKILKRYGVPKLLADNR